MVKKKILFGATYSIIEPLGLLHLSGLARDLNWDRRIHLVKDHNFESFFEEVKDFKPNIVGFNVYTGNHIQLFDSFKRLRKEHPNIETIVGGPHATYFPVESSRNADYVVMSEGFGALREILNGEVGKGIFPMKKTEKFPHPDRETFYQDYPEHGKSKIKSIISMTGCPYKCTYCYNSSTLSDIEITPELAQSLAFSLGMSGRLFPHNVRSVEDVVKEGIELNEKWPTKVVYFQDDVFGFDVNEWLPKFVEEWQKVGIPWHAQMRWEMTKNEERLDLIKKGGCFGMTLAIEAANPIIRREVLDRDMKEEIIFNGMKSVIERGLKIRTEQITGLPYGATSQETKMNLEADLELVEMNVKLREQTGGPAMAWTSTFAPYAGTKLGMYSKQFGHYESLDNHDVPDTFFDRSVLRFPREWIGLSLAERKNDSSVWLSEDKLEEYRNMNAELRRIFNFVTLVPKGDELARTYLEKKEPFSFERLGRETEEHLKNIVNYGGSIHLVEAIKEIRNEISRYNISENEKDQLRDLAPYFGVLPKGKLAVERFLRYGREKGFTPKVLSNATRHHLYDNILYDTEENRANEPFTYRSSLLKV